MNRLFILLALVSICCVGCKGKLKAAHGPPRLCIICDESDTNSINIRVSEWGDAELEARHAVPVSRKGTFSGYYMCLVGGQERKRLLQGTNNVVVGFPANRITYCEVQKSPDIDWIHLEITQNGQTIFSEWTNSNATIRYRGEYEKR